MKRSYAFLGKFYIHKHPETECKPLKHCGKFYLKLIVTENFAQNVFHTVGRAVIVSANIFALKCQMFARLLLIKIILILFRAKIIHEY